MANTWNEVPYDTLAPLNIGDQVSLKAQLTGGGTALLADGEYNTINIVQFKAITIPEPGDYNGDDVVDAVDYTVWRNNFGTDFDLNGNGDETGDSMDIVDEADFIWWKEHYGNSNLGPGGGGLAQAPRAGTDDVDDVLGDTLRRSFADARQCRRLIAGDTGQQPTPFSERNRCLCD